MPLRHGDQVARDLPRGEPAEQFASATFYAAAYKVIPARGARLGELGEPRGCYTISDSGQRFAHINPQIGRKVPFAARHRFLPFFALPCLVWRVIRGSYIYVLFFCYSTLKHATLHQSHHVIIFYYFFIDLKVALI
jgi:hypothetical protein